MFGLVKKQIYSIGIDTSDDNLKLIQLQGFGKKICLLAGLSENRPEDIKPGSSDWQRWAIMTIGQLTSNGNFQGREVIGAMPSAEVFIDHIKMPKAKDCEMEDVIFSKIKQKLPFEPVQANTLMKCIPTEQENIIVIATERELVNRHLAIYEKAGLSIRSIGVWPVALTSCYTKFFGRRQSDLEAVVMLICMEANRTNAVICRHKKLLFVRSIPIGIEQLDDEAKMSSLVLELTSFKRQFSSVYRNIQIERLIFFSSRASDRDVCIKIAKQLEMPAQIGDCLAAVEMAHSFNPNRNGRSKAVQGGIAIDRRDCQLNWSVAFGLSLSEG